MFLGVCGEILINLIPFEVFPTALIAHQNFQDPLISYKKIPPIKGFRVLKTSGLNPGFQHKNRVGKICTESWVIGKNVSKYAGLVWRPWSWHILINISGPGAYFSKPIAALKPLAQAGCFEYHEPYKRNNFFLPLKRAHVIFNKFVPFPQAVSDIVPFLKSSYIYIQIIISTSSDFDDHDHPICAIYILVLWLIG